MMIDRSVAINLAGSEYELVLTTKAMKEILIKYNSLEELGQSLARAEAGGSETMLDDLVWLVVLLANQSILIQNLNVKNAKDKKELLTTEFFELSTTPQDFIDSADKVFRAINKGMGRYIESEEIEKN